MKARLCRSFLFILLDVDRCDCLVRRFWKKARDGFRRLRLSEITEAAETVIWAAWLARKVGWKVAWKVV